MNRQEEGVTLPVRWVILTPLKAIGFFISKMGIQDLGYQGNAPGRWEGVPQHILKKYGLENI